MCTLKTLFIALCLLTVDKMVAQSTASTPILPTVTPPSPAAASLGRFGSYQVNLFTGLPEISIPLYEIKSGELAIPIAISYHASGIKVTDWGNWVGLGWSLSAGGNITRTVMGRPDEGSGGYFTNTSHTTTGTISTSTQDGLDYLHNLYSNSLDGDPDVFSYNIPGKSGKFVFNNQNSFAPILMPYAPIKISRSPMFDITDEGGKLYQFRLGESSSGNSGSPISTWLMTKMFSANKKDSIQLNYADRTGYSSQTGSDNLDYVVVSDMVTDYSTGSAHNPYTADLGQGFTSSVGYFVSEEMINTILFRGGKVVFDTSVADRQDGYVGQKSLADIKVYNYDAVSNTYSIIKTIYFYQSYFNPSGTNTTKRLRLDSLGIAGSDGIIREKYKFVYNNTITLPDKTSRSRDFWGYYNGKSNNTLVPQTVIPDYQSTSSSTVGSITIGSTTSGSRDANPSYMQMGMLQSIYFPTGGHTDFTFETNQCYNGNTTMYAGGLRVANIKSYDGISATPIVKTYKYGDQESGIGRGNYILPYNFRMVQQLYRYYAYQSGTGGACEIKVGTKRVRTYYATPTIEEAPYDQAPVVYDTVTEYTGDNTTNIGKTMYVFTDHPDGLSSVMYAHKPVVTTYYMDRGLLANKIDYVNKGSGNYVKVHETQNLYGAYSEQFYGNIGMAVFKHTITQNSIADDIPLGPMSYPECWDDGTNYLYSNYSLRTADNKLTQTIDSTFDQLNPTKKFTTKVNYYYDNFNHQQVTRIFSVNSKGDSIKVFKQYPSDKGAVAPYNTMVSLNIQNKTVQEQYFNNMVQVKQGNSNYQDMSNGNYLPANVTEQLLNNPVEPRASFNRYDNLGNILEMQKTSDQKMSIIWDYKQAYPVAKVNNAQYSDVAFTSFESDGTGNWSGISNGNVVTDANSFTGGRYYNMNSIGLTKNNLTSSTHYIISYWSKNGQYTVSGTPVSGWPKTLRSLTINGTTWTNYEHNVTPGSTSLSITYPSGTGGIDELRLYPETAQMTTFTYKPLVGLTSQCDLNGKATYYEYDPYNRLTVIRDQDRNVLKKICYSYQNQPTDNCIPAPTVTLSSYNEGYSGFTATYTNVATGSVYSFSIPASGGANIGTVPGGIYTISIGKPGNSDSNIFFQVCTASAGTSGTSATFSNITVSAAGPCNVVNISSLF